MRGGRRWRGSGRSASRAALAGSAPPLPELSSLPAALPAEAAAPPLPAPPLQTPSDLPDLRRRFGTLLPVPPDGLCLFYACAAARMYEEWSQQDRTSAGYAVHQNRQRLERQAAEQVRLELFDRMLECALLCDNLGDSAGATQLTRRIEDIREGDMPGDSEHVHIAHIMGGRLQMVALGMADYEPPRWYGEGRHVLTVGWLQSIDDQGHAAGHFELVETRLPLPAHRYTSKRRLQ